ncbi:MAG: CDP-diacylglycerol--glycerol-3-phosphate 3-phosphatidyltransferase [Yoonia sp.]|jgi:CDP-diacylglycerol--glycerol-3-phosphate 3-phosphatidyltransferase|nr:CDP-diacylglycerol--glycerol-3-phosphate 3-phosphatidyltransferase [Yoonia sp.]
MNWNIPNILTLLRLIASPAVAIMFLYFNRPLADWFALILFVGAAFTDFLDGYLARAWKQESKLGAMMDPIADKAMVIIALVVITGFSGMNPWILLPATLIIFREVFVSGLREFLGETAGLLAVTKVAKWKTTVQMFAISVLFAKGAFEHYLIERSVGMDDATFDAIMDGVADDPLGLRGLALGWDICWYGGIGLLWIAMVLTVISGADYFRKAIPYLKDSQ